MLACDFFCVEDCVCWRLAKFCFSSPGFGVFWFWFSLGVGVQCKFWNFWVLGFVLGS